MRGTRSRRRREEYALARHNCLVFVCSLTAFLEAFKRRDVEQVARIISFVGCCLKKEYASDSEDVSVAAGVGFAEHLFDDVEVGEYSAIHEIVGTDFYRLSEPWLQKWLEPEVFAAVQRAKTNVAT